MDIFGHSRLDFIWSIEIGGAIDRFFENMLKGVTDCVWLSDCVGPNDQEIEYLARDEEDTICYPVMYSLGYTDGFTLSVSLIPDPRQFMKSLQDLINQKSDCNPDEFCDYLLGLYFGIKHGGAEVDSNYEVFRSGDEKYIVPIDPPRESYYEMEMREIEDAMKAYHSSNSNHPSCVINIKDAKQESPSSDLDQLPDFLKPSCKPGRSDRQ